MLKLPKKGGDFHEKDHHHRFESGFRAGTGGNSGTGLGAWFGPGFGRGFGGPAYGSPPIPNLTADQSAQIQALRDSFLKEIEPLQKELYAKGQELRKLWSTQNVDPAAIKAKQNEISDIRSQLQDKATNLGLEIRKVLTPEQLAQLPALALTQALAIMAWDLVLP